MTNAANDKSCSDDLDAESVSSTASPPEFLWEVVEETRDHALILLDPEGRIVSWHDGARALLGYEASEIIGTHFSRLYPTHAIEGCWPEIELKLMAAEGRFTGEGWRVRRDGSRFWASVELVAVRDSAGELRGFGQLARDTSHLRRPRLLDASESNGFTSTPSSAIPLGTRSVGRGVRRHRGRCRRSRARARTAGLIQLSPSPAIRSQARSAGRGLNLSIIHRLTEDDPYA
jgi:PAS domain S-box-containing protein